MINEAIYFGEDDENPFSDAKIMVTMSREELHSLLDALALHENVRARQLYGELREILTSAEMRIFKILTTYNSCDVD